MIKDALTSVVGAALVITICITPFVWAGSYACDAYKEVTGKQTKYKGLECYINDSGVWYAWPEYKNRFVAKGQMQ